MMQPSEKVLTIRNMLAQGTSRRQVSHQLGVGRNQVRAIHRALRPNDQRRRRCTKERPLRPRFEHLRCKTCGGLVHLPCIACQIARLWSETQVASGETIHRDAYLGIELRGSDFHRYLSVKQARDQGNAVNLEVDAMDPIDQGEIEMEMACRAAFDK